MEVTRCTKNLGTLIIRSVEKKLAKSIIIENHYSHKWNDSFGIMNFGIFRESSDKCLGVAVFGRMMNSHSFKSISDDLEKNEIVELNRLWVDDCLGHNAESLFIGACFKILRSEYPEIKTVQSFADGRLGVGTIYKATNFKYFGVHKTSFYENTVTGEVTHNAQNRCEWCGKTETDVLVHQVCSLKELKCENEWEQFMKQINRKTLVVCNDCYRKMSNVNCE